MRRRSRNSLGTAPNCATTSCTPTASCNSRASGYPSSQPSLCSSARSCSCTVAGCHKGQGPISWQQNIAGAGAGTISLATAGCHSGQVPASLDVRASRKRGHGDYVLLLGAPSAPFSRLGSQSTGSKMLGSQYTSWGYRAKAKDLGPFHVVSFTGSRVGGCAGRVGSRGGRVRHAVGL